MMKKIIFGLILFSLATRVLAQSVHISGQWGVSEFASNLNMEKEEPDIKGSPYLHKDFMYGEAETYKGQNFNGMFRYNIYNEEMEFIYRNDTLIIDNPIILKYIKFSAKKFTYSVIVDNKWRSTYIHGGYFEVLNNGNAQLLIKYVMDFRKNVYVPYYAGGGGDGSFKYIPEQRLYFRLNIDEPAIKLKANKRFITNLFPEHKAEILAFIKSNNTNMKDKNDLIQLFDYINTIN